ncbi:protein phosphatase 1 regulatory subunit 11, partial [Tremellales sp. Uapishka_1]
MAAPQSAPQPTEHASRTITTTHTPSNGSQADTAANQIGVLRLRGGPMRRQRVIWAEETVDNEGMGRKKSKICCIYHRPKAYDESSSESSSSDAESDVSNDQPAPVPRRIEQKKNGKAKDTSQSSESEGGQGNDRARPSRPSKHRHQHHYADCCSHPGPSKPPAKANKYDVQDKGKNSAKD